MRLAGTCHPRLDFLGEVLLGSRVLKFVEIFSIQSAVGSRDPKVSYLASTLSQLQQFVIQQFRLVNIKDDTIYHSERPVKKSPSGSESIPEPLPQPLISEATPVEPPNTGNSPCLQSVPKEAPKTKKRKTGSKKGENLSDADHVVVDLTQGRSSPDPVPPLIDDDQILGYMLANIRHKVSKARWTHDLQEFATGHPMSISQFAQIQESIVQAGRSFGKRGINDLSSSPRRPCWGITGKKMIEALGKRDRQRFKAIKDALQALQESGTNVHTLYILYDFDIEHMSIKAVCSLINQAAS